jgi:hypothetical protein
MSGVLFNIRLQNRHISRHPSWGQSPHRRLKRFCLGAACFASAEPLIDENHIAHYNGRDAVSVTAVVVDDPEIWDRFIQLKVKSEAIESRDGPIVPVTGLLLVTVPRYPEVSYGARVRVTGRLQEPENFGEFDYKSFLARQDVHSQMSWPTVTVTSEGHDNPVYYGIYAFKDKAQETIKSLLPNPHASLLTGILLGNDNELSPDLDDAFRKTGMTHIIAISGFRTMIWQESLAEQPRWLRVPKYGFHRFPAIQPVSGTDQKAAHQIAPHQRVGGSARWWGPQRGGDSRIPCNVTKM